MRKVLDVVARWGGAVLWATLPFTAGPTLAAALDPAGAGFRTFTSVAAWTVWVLTLVATLVPRTTTLTAVRIVVPTAPLAIGWAVVTLPTPGWQEALALTVTTLAAVVVLAPQTGDVFIDGSSYGHERRMALRAPGVLLLGPIEAVWVAVVAGAAAGPLLVASGTVPGGLALTAIGWAIAVAGVRALHTLARRWLVFTQAGVVIVDPLALADTLLVRRSTLAWLGPAPAGTGAHDLTVGALGLAVELRFAEPVTITPLPPRRSGRSRPAPAAIDVDAVLVAPSLPGRMLEEARRRRLPVQAAMPPPTTSSPS
ncbi:hypothetical protein [Rhabdothermincola sp.]|uniref:hypothetical protein n=1 Tax=Rhabdothermincola sp. TaxID=2820405 RepID=UPI002FE2CB09